MTQLFADGFESASYAAWTSTVLSGSGTALAISFAASIQGTYGSRSTHNHTASDQSFEAKVSKTFTPPTTGVAFAQALVRMSVVSVGYSVAGSKAVLALRAADGTPQAWFSIRSGGLRFSYRSRSGATVSVNSNIPVTGGTPIWLRLMVDRSGVNPVVEGWTSIDGVIWTSVGAAGDGTSGTNGVGKPTAVLDTGVVHISNAETGNYYVDVDSVSVSDSIGETNWQVLSNLTQPITFTTLSRAEFQSASEMALVLSATNLGLRNDLGVSEAAFALSVAHSAAMEHLATIRSVLDIVQATEIVLEGSSESALLFALVADHLAYEEWRVTTVTDFSLRAERQHSIIGSPERPVRVVVTVAPWGRLAISHEEG